mmetsp:Transcript_5342/g.7945  ORF Transcript_5342/g.7945 Transcript_5342/m.7945 type:complete len:227 (+) Transcript_5342:2683-3363(+)
MSRAFHPPDSLSKEDVRKIADVRRDVWTSGFKGLFYGAASGYTLHTTCKLIHDRLLNDNTKAKLRSLFNATKGNPLFTRNTAFLSFMGGGALGSFVMATTTGKNEVHELHDIFKIGEKETKKVTPYQESIQKDKEKMMVDASASVLGDGVEDINDRKKRRLSRRKTVANRLEKGRGLSDSHGGHWVEDERDGSMTQKQRAIRRRTMTKRLEEGKGLSDSHSGRWNG